MRRLRLLVLTLIISTSLSSAAQALPTLFTDRATFDAVVGSTTLLTFDTQPVQTLSPIAPTLWSLTFDGLLTTGMRDIGSYQGGTMIVNGDFCFCSQYGAGGFTLHTVDPVYALAVEVTPLDANAAFEFAGARYILNQPTFFGILVTDPTPITFGQTVGLTSVEPSRFRIDNVAIKTVPEPSSGILLSLLIGAMAWAHRSRRLHHTAPH